MNTKTKSPEELKQTVKEKYGRISGQSKSKNEGSCCGADCGCDTVDYAVFPEDYSSVEGYNENANLGLGCGLPTEYAHISKGDTVVDLGSGAGNDCFVARQLTGSEGRVIGLDMTEEMIEKAQENAAKIGYENVEFVLGDIEKMPFENNTADVVVSNCVLNLVPDKPKAFAEIYRIIKPGGHFSISDVVTSGALPQSIKEDAEMYAGCVSGAVNRNKYVDIVKKAGFKNLKIQKDKRVELPEKMLSNYLSDKEIKKFQ
ncbi:MAG TPA: arsenite methyltransferase, partial [Balneolaceae bacterium]|nr:arsenite methyltransferase [Balneolaceae bacterium]